mmetsp:Transcript_12492/g.29429  ORF Transcript_12492/g.29429 Transcript_12492/m.29429 type:complete len:315 (-) Transcript_12492:165-1109(-)|eukprot:CAMPEP_0178437094 /NCGR_PEP_ID=MMETSP0689_2-20121128/34790_1 /TAXON_ID=160604 /ORGANISM="Amphidinium massartii, Strain CS-259" /LENGTH=314 /DNA_ID=CAMNT_0020059235 /DNA_START=58 /DNA_END=1002 /DNA_ORIENTATION=-
MPSGPELKTIRFNRPTFQSSFEDVCRQTAAVFVQRISVALCGEYSYTFQNTADRAVKVHMIPDAGSSAHGDSEQMASKAAEAGVIVCVPPKSGEVKIPFKSPSILVRAGFEHEDTGFCEIFWTLRRFEWEPTITITFRPEHSQANNTFHEDVHVWSPHIIDPRGQDTMLLEAQAKPPGATLPPVGVTAGPFPEQPLPPTPELESLTARSLSLWAAGCDPSPQLGHCTLRTQSRGDDQRPWFMRAMQSVAEGAGESEDGEVLVYRLDTGMWEPAPKEGGPPKEVATIRRADVAAPPSQLYNNLPPGDYPTCVRTL